MVTNQKKTFGEKYGLLTEELKQIKSADKLDNKEAINGWFRELINFHKSEYRSKIRKEFEQGDSEIIRKLWDEIYSQLKSKRECDIFQQEIKKEKKLAEKNPPSLNNTHFFANLDFSDIDEETILNCLIEIKELAIKRARFEEIVNNLLYFYGETSLITKKDCKAIVKVIREAKVGNEQEIDASLTQIINEFRQKIATEWNKPVTNIDATEAKEFVFQEVSNSLNYLKYFYETDLKDKVITKGWEKFGKWDGKNIKDLVTKYQELMDNKKSWEKAKFQQDNNYQKLLEDSFASDYQVLSREEINLRAILTAYENLNLLEESSNPDQLKQAYVNLRWDSIGAKIEELKDWIDKWLELRESLTKITERVGEINSGKDLPLIEQIKKEFESKLQEYRDQNDNVIDKIIGYEPLIMERDWMAKLDLFPTRIIFQESIEKTLQEAQEIDNSIDIEENWKEKLYSEESEEKAKDLVDEFEQEIVDKSYDSVRGSTEVLLQEINLLEEDYLLLLDNWEKEVKDNDWKVGRIKNWKKEVDQDLKFVLEEWTENLQSPDKIQAFKQQLIVSSLPGQTELGKLVLDKKKDEIKSHLETYLTAFKEVKTYLDKISQVTQQGNLQEINNELALFASYQIKKRKEEIKGENRPTLNALDNWASEISQIVNDAQQEKRRQILVIEIKSHLSLAQREISTTIKIKNDWQEEIKQASNEEKITSCSKKLVKEINQQARTIVENDLALGNGKLQNLDLNDLIAWKKEGTKARTHRDNLLAQANNDNIHKEKEQVAKLVNQLQELEKSPDLISQTIYQQKATEIKKKREIFQVYSAAYRSIEEILGLAEKAIVSKQLTQLEAAEKELSSLLEEKKPEKKKIYSLYLEQIDKKLKEVVRQKSICQIEEERAKARKIGVDTGSGGEDWKADIGTTPIADLPGKEQGIKNDLLRQVISNIVAVVEKDLGIARKIVPVNKRIIALDWKEEVKKIPNVDKGQELKIRLQGEILQKTRINIITFVNKKLAEYNLKSEQLAKPYCRFVAETERKKTLVELAQWQKALAVHLEEKGIQQGKIEKNLTASDSGREIKWEYILPIAALGGTGIMSLVWLRSWLKKSKKLRQPVNSNNSPLMQQSRLAFANYYANLRKAKKNGYNSQLFEEINKNLKEIGEITERLEQELQEKKWKGIQKEYKKYKNKTN